MPNTTRGLSLTLSMALTLAVTAFTGPTLAFEPCQEPEARDRSLTPDQHDLFAYAARLFAGGRFAAAYGRFSKLADAGHLPSAQLALAMYRQGPRVFGSDWDATEEQLERWSALVQCDALRATRHQ